MKYKQKILKILALFLVIFMGIPIGTTVYATGIEGAMLKSPNMQNSFEDTVFSGKLVKGLENVIQADNENLFSNLPQTYSESYTQSIDLSDSVILTKNIVKLDGKEYTGGNVTVEPGDPFSYEFEWELNGIPKEGDTFQKEIFQIPGLVINSYKDQPAVIYTNGRNIRIGTWNLIYDKTTGKMIFSMNFSKYASAFTEIQGFKKGVGKFDSKSSGSEIIVLGEKTGTLTIEESKEIITPPTNPSGNGIGWSAPKAPTFNSNDYAFGKGKKWDSHNSENSVPSMEWRAVYLDYLQDIQNKLIDTNKDLLGTGSIQGSIENEDSINTSVLTETSGNYIIEDTLDVNQSFYLDYNDKKYPSEAPFFFEIPIAIPGTGNFIAGSIGNGYYDGNGDFPDYITGDKLTHVTEDTADLNGKSIEEYVKDNPLTWAVVKITDADKKIREKLIINIGKLGTTNDQEGLVLKDSLKNTVLNRIQTQINNSKNYINALNNGTNSPVDFLKSKTDALQNFINSKNWATDESTATFTAFNNWYTENFNTAEKKKIALTDEAKASLVSIKLSEAIQSLVSSHAELANEKTYKDWKTNFDNLQANQNTYATNHEAYLKNWQYALGRYQLTKAFYKEGRVYGFSMKYFVKVVNPTAKTFSNSITISTQDKSYDAEDSVNIAFNVGISGVFSKGSAVFKKADSGYDSYKNAGDNGLAGAMFRVYCGDSNGVYVEDDKHLSIFADKDASENNNAYVWSHNKGDSESVNSGIVDNDNGLTELTTDSKGTLAIEGLEATHKHYLVETQAPEGYYLDSTPIEFKADTSTVINTYVPNIARAVTLKKVSSYDNKPVEGAEFTLYDADTNEPLKGGFVKKSLRNGSITTDYYLYDKNASNQTLKTFSDGKLNIHGLPVGSYYLKETKAASGFVLSGNENKKYSFKLEEEITDEVKASLHEENGFYYTYATCENEPAYIIYNDEATKELTFTKVNENGVALSGASFELLTWNGTEEQWNTDPTNKNYWKTVEVNAEDSPYFQTNAVKDGSGYSVDENGKLTFTGIPNGRYAIAETKIPTGYQGLNSYIYFNVDVSNNNPIQLYWNVNEDNIVNDNKVPNVLLAGSLKIQKKVSGTYGDKTKDFDFSINLKDSNGIALTGSYSCIRTNESGEKTEILNLDNSGNANLKLKSGEEVIISNLPHGTQCIVEEDKADGYETKIDINKYLIDENGDKIEEPYQSNSINGQIIKTTIEGNQITDICYTNTKTTIPDTGIKNLITPWKTVCIFVVTAIGVYSSFLYTKHKRKDKIQKK